MKATATAAAPWAVEVTAKRWQQLRAAGLPSGTQPRSWAYRPDTSRS